MHTLIYTVGEDKPEKLEKTLSNYVRKTPSDTLANKLQVRKAGSFGDILSDVKANTLCDSLAATQPDAAAATNCNRLSNRQSRALVDKFIDT